MPKQDTDCLFCKIASQTIPVQVVWGDDYALAFPDINPQAPKHFLVIPRDHFTNVTEVPEDLLGHLLRGASAIAKRELPEGHRIVINTGTDGGQTVGHVHLHVLGGRHMSWPPG